jgi:hypothetical protein
LYFAAQWHNVIGGLGLWFASYSTAFWMLVVLDRNPIFPSVSDIGGTAHRNIATSAFMVIQCSLMLAGGISMHQHKRRWLALVGAWAGILPLCGCYVFSLVSGVWVLVVVRRPEVKSLFEPKPPSDHES